MTLASGSTIKQLALSSGKPAVLDRLSTTNSGNIEYIDRIYRLTSIGPYAGLEAIAFLAVELDSDGQQSRRKHDLQRLSQAVSCRVGFAARAQFFGQLYSVRRLSVM